MADKEEVQVESLDIEAGGDLTDGVLTITAELGKSWIVVTVGDVTDEEAYEHADILVSTLANVVGAVVTNIEAQLAKDDNDVQIGGDL